MTDQPSAVGRPAIRFQQGKPFLSLIANHAGYALLAEVFSKLSRAGAGSYARHGQDAAAAASVINEALVPGSGQRLGECIIDDALSHESAMSSEKTRWWRDRRALLTCGVLVLLGLVVLGVLARGMAAIWHDLR